MLFTHYGLTQLVILNLKRKKLRNFLRISVFNDPGAHHSILWHEHLNDLVLTQFLLKSVQFLWICKEFQNGADILLFNGSHQSWQVDCVLLWCLQHFSMLVLILFRSFRQKPGFVQFLGVYESHHSVVLGDMSWNTSIWRVKLALKTNLPAPPAHLHHENVRHFLASKSLADNQEANFGHFDTPLVNNVLFRNPKDCSCNILVLVSQNKIEILVGTR